MGASDYRLRVSKELGLAGNHYDAIQNFLDQYEAAIARELTAKIRDFARERPAPEVRIAMRRAADLIDPDKEQS